MDSWIFGVSFFDLWNMDVGCWILDFFNCVVVFYVGVCIFFSCGFWTSDYVLCIFFYSDFWIWGFWIVGFLEFGFGGTSPDRPGESAGGVGGTARPGNPNAFLYRESKNPFRQAWLGNEA